MNIILSEKANVIEMTTQANIATSDINKQTEVVRLTPTGYSDNKLVYVVRFHFADNCFNPVCWH